MKKKKLRNLILFVLAIVILTTIFIMVFKGKKSSSEDSNALIGSWTTDGVTVYTFNEDFTGVLEVPLANYEFTYKIVKDKISIDFKNEKSEDTDFVYSFNKGNLILTGKNGKFIFKKKK